jgi:hypothetical protein
VNRPRGQHILAPADLLLLDGDPLPNLDLVACPGRNFVVIIKDGKVHKNTLRPCPARNAGSRGIDASTTRYRRARPRHRPTGIPLTAAAPFFAPAVGLLSGGRSFRRRPR